MLKVNFPIGNIFLDNKFNYLQNEDFEKLNLSRIDLEKRILRRITDCGTDVGLNLNYGVKLCHGDIIENTDRVIVIEQLPEKLISVKLKTKNIILVMVLLGYIIGNSHRPISIGNDEILFPITHDSEKEIFTKLFQSIINYIEITVKVQIFSPNVGANIHEH